jgi:hypothetical protein
MSTFTCRYFNGIMNDKCAAGVAYDSVRCVAASPAQTRLPCICIAQHGDQTVVQRKTACAKYEAETDDDRAAEEKAHQESMARFQKLRPLTDRIRRENKGKSWRGVETCPICQGRIFLSIAGCNGHMHGRCETTGCVSWME